VTSSVRISAEELQRLRSLAHPPDPTAVFEFYCATCDRPFKTRGIGSLCPHCLSVSVKHGLRDLGEVSGS
jgi:hypothetical protein